MRPLPPEWTPLRALEIVGRDPYTLFFESGGPAGEASEWTILAFDPLYRLVLRDGRLRRMDPGGSDHELDGHPLDALARAWPAPVHAAEGQAAEIPFISGLAGYLSYDLKDWIERYPSHAVRDLDFPGLSLRFHDVVWAWKRSTGEGWVVSTGLAGDEEGRTANLAFRAGARLAEQWILFKKEMGRTPERTSVPTRPTTVTSTFTRLTYESMVARALEYIAAGDIYQVNLAQRFRVEPVPPALDVYRALRTIAPAPFLAFASLPDGGIASSSPERFFRIKGRTIETWPIKGTRPRGRTPEEDARLLAELRASAKDHAENVMIVDLERNDLGRVCETGSVRVPALCDVVSHSNVHHLESRVEGTLREDAHPVDVLRALMPGGSITGAPKIRAVEIIDELEPVRRAVYTGAIGYWDVRGGCDWNIAIRTISVVDDVAYFHAGGGVVADSTPAGEYEETLVKASGMMRALGVDAHALDEALARP
ncbi:MAG TPA: aminodeoxychorismate synthase component I [Candidatus Eisenbacteria bacterium]|nr:aminodeoxychorismate synthase component I [Candidatus Eisenbacteria bacterium]